MKLLKIKPSKSLSKAYYKQSLSREQIELFKKELQNTFNHIDEKQDEEYHKNVIADLFKNVYCKDKYLVNVNKKEDLVIRLGNTTTDDVGVLLEFKKPTEKRDMVSAENANVKALQEVVLYYLRQTVDNENHKITNLVVTNIYEWFIFDGVWFEKNIFRNSKLKKEYLAYKTSGHDTKYFYDTIAAKYLAEFTDEVPCTYFNLKDYEAKITNDNKKDDDDLIDLYKILSPEHLLNKKFANDSNSLNTDFYNELLYIIGLEESKETAKKTIRRINEAERNEGSLIENTISKLKTKKYFGYENNEQTENQYYEVALELCITWLNRILFLKLLESQLIKYHRGDKENYSFLSYSKIKDFDELEELFFEVLAEKTADRNPSIATKYKDIPYLNSSLFEMTDLEKNALALSNLKDRLEFAVYKKSILKKGTKETIKPKTSLNYLLDFLDAYNFASESNAKIQEENKSIINASVLGLIFEKINGYKDGSFFTPGFITMYMCRETIRKAVVEKFKNSFPYCKDITDYEELKDKIDYTNKAQRVEANKLINDIKIVDPAVGSGHFLVSALNEMIAIKSDLQILSYANGNRVLGYTITLDNDELIIQNQETDKLFEYTLNQNNNVIPDLQELQDCLFTEKQTIIENCLFGVDINPKSVMICQLRLWIELLKNAYYTKESDYKELHTLPNIDINIKIGNSLISKFAIKDNVFERISGFQKKLTDYKKWVSIYKSTNDKKAKDVLKKNLQLFKDEFKLADLRVNKLQNELRKLNGEFYDKYQTHQFFTSELTDKQAKAKEKLEKEINDKQVEIQTVKDNPIYKDAFEWRFEFPEVLDDKGGFVGFDVVIGNPPYFQIQYSIYGNIELLKSYSTYEKTGDIYSLFFEKSIDVLKTTGIMSLITSNRFCNTNYGRSTRNYLSKFELILLANLNNVSLFDEANVGTLISIIKKNKPENLFFKSFEISDIKTAIDIQNYSNKHDKNTEQFFFNDNHWIFGENKLLKLKNKIESNGLPLSKIKEIKINRGITTGSNSVFIIDRDFGDELIKRNPKNSEILKPVLKGAEIKRFFVKDYLNYIILTKTGVDIEKYPDVYNYLLENKDALENVYEAKKGMKKWFELRSCSYYDSFESEKLIWTRLSNINSFSLSLNKEYSIDSTSFATGKNLKYYSAILNSKLVLFYFKLGSVIWGKDGIKWFGEFFDNIPIVESKEETQKPIISLVDQILTLKKENPKADTSNLENDIDKLVYKLYDLTPEEVEVVKNS